MGKRLRYQVAASLDGFIAGPDGSYDWIVMDPAIDFTALYGEFDTAVMGRKTYAAGLAMGGNVSMPGIDIVVFSRTLSPATQAGLRITNEAPASVVAELKKKKGRDIWLFGGGELFRSLLDASLVDTVEIAVMPVLLGDGIPLLPAGHSARLVLTDVKKLPASGIVVLAYAVEGTTTRPPKVRYVKSPRRKA